MNLYLCKTGHRDYYALTDDFNKAAMLVQEKLGIASYANFDDGVVTEVKLIAREVKDDSNKIPNFSGGYNLIIDNLSKEGN
jgi:hypothetical protein